MQIPGFLIETAKREDRQKIHQLMEQIFIEFNLIDGSLKMEDDITNLEAAYAGGYFGLIKKLDKTIVGCFGLFPISSKVAEIRKVYLQPEFRGNGNGRKLIGFLLEKAKTIGFETVVLETATKFEAAIHLYKKFGFEEIRSPQQTSLCDRKFKLSLLKSN